MQLLQVDTIAIARAKLLQALSQQKLHTTTLPLSQLLGHILAADIISPETVPAFDRSTVDGYAVIAADTVGATEGIPAFLNIIGRVEMGQATSLSLKPGDCVYVPTGAMLPHNTDAVVMVEYCESFGEGIAVYQAVAVGSHLTRRGEETAAGEVILQRGSRLRAPELGVLACLGIVEAQVYQPLRLALISTGDELVAPSATPKIGQVRDLNTTALAAQATAAGYLVGQKIVVPDQEELLLQAVRSCLADHDLVVISGGSSQGEKDATASVIAQSGQLLTQGLAAKPGKPTITGYDQASATLLVGLPVHPIAAMLVFETLLSWLWRQLSGDSRSYLLQAELAHNLPGSPGKETLQLVSLHEAEGHYIATPIWGKSALITRLAQADGYLVIDQNTEGLAGGTMVRVHLI